MEILGRRLSYQANESMMIRWQVEQVNRYWVYREDQNWQDHQDRQRGAERGAPSVDTTWYYGRYLNGKAETLPCTIYVEPPPPQAPVITRFTADPEQINLGGAFHPRRQSCTSRRSMPTARSATGAVLTSALSTARAGRHCEYVLEVENADGTHRRRVGYAVQPQPQAPVITQFSAEPDKSTWAVRTINRQIDNGRPATLYANNVIQGGATAAHPLP
jgi:hypothetical protein